MKVPGLLNDEQRIRVLESVQAVLWLDGESWNGDKKWNSETIDEVARIMANFGLRPEANE
jgi:hypothetical protein